MALTNAEKQAAHRARLKARLEAAPVPLPPAPALSHMPASKRWKALQQQAVAALRLIVEEMESYSAERSDAWQESERGQAFADQLTDVQCAFDQVDSIEIS